MYTCSVISLCSMRYFIHTIIFRSAIEAIRSEGAPALERMQNEADNLYFDLTIILRYFSHVTMMCSH